MTALRERSHSFCLAEFKEPRQAFYAEVDSGRFTLITPAIVDAEIEPVPQHIREFFSRYLEVAEVINPTKEAIKLHQTPEEQLAFWQQRTEALKKIELLE